MTLSDVALPHGRPSGKVDRPWVSARGRARVAVTRRDRKGFAVVRRIGRVMYLDAADSWVVRDHSPAPRAVWNSDYTVSVPDAYPPFVWWCRFWRYPAVVLGCAFDAAKFLHIHPVRGPVTIAIEGAIVAYLNH